MRPACQYCRRPSGEEHDWSKHPGDDDTLRPPKVERRISDGAVLLVRFNRQLTADETRAFQEYAERFVKVTERGK